MPHESTVEHTEESQGLLEEQYVLAARARDSPAQKPTDPTTQASKRQRLNKNDSQVGLLYLLLIPPDFINFSENTRASLDHEGHFSHSNP